jgi:hypothetical protein
VIAGIIGDLTKERARLRRVQPLPAEQRRH